MTLRWLNDALIERPNNCAVTFLTFGLTGGHHRFLPGAARVASVNADMHSLKAELDAMSA